MQPGGKRMSPRELSELSDRGEGAQTTPLWRER
ncbi:hypothetical protein CU560_06185 [Serratia ureilytica]|nr:hypothetical protein CU560_06185 [Serratia ureilytica]